MKKSYVFFSIIILFICCVGTEVQVTALEGGKAHQQNTYYPELSDNSFYRTHKKECKRGGSSYLAKKEVTCYKNPESHVISSTIDKGSSVEIICTYQTNFDTWGLASNGLDKWVKLRDLEFAENVYSFVYEYKKEMGRVKDSELKKALGTVVDTLQKDIVKWSYPCSGKIVGKCSKKKYPTMDSILMNTWFIYQDKQKRYWRIYGGDYDSKTGEYKPYAICLSDPENDQIEKEITLTKPYTGGKYGRWLVVIPIGIVICILIATFIILRVRSKFRIKKMVDDI
ncbi:MAG: hypothetical protein HFH62_14690 [Lachnospiraceae bacterium]|nr:hypothetical protein [Lachnospiraceae bacterium]